MQTYDFEAGETLCFDKPKEWTSFDVVAKIRNALKIKKIGHAGTLDPLATGVLLLCTGKKTKTIADLQNADKEYVAQICFGATTPSFDAEFAPENFQDASGVTPQTVEALFPDFTGEILQTPPAFSAVKVNGARAYDLARAGKTPEIAARPVHIHAIELLSFESPQAVTLRVHCGKGTYLRSLARDLGERLGCGAYLTDLRRTRIGVYSVETAWSIPAFVEKFAKDKILHEEKSF